MKKKPHTTFVHPRNVEYEKEIRWLRENAAGPHYRWVQFLTGLSAGMLGLSAPLQPQNSSQKPCSEWLAALALIGLTIAVLAGVYALYGEKAAFDRRWKRMKALREKHRDALKADEELNQEPLVRPHASYRWAFNILWTVWLVSILMLAASKIVHLFQLPICFPASTHAPAMSSEPPCDRRSVLTEPSFKANFGQTPQ